MFYSHLMLSRETPEQINANDNSKPLRGQEGVVLDTKK